MLRSAPPLPPLGTLLLLLLFSSVSAQARLGVDVSAHGDEAYWRCMTKTYDVEFAIVRAYHSYGAPDDNAAVTIPAAWAAGIKHVDAYIFPCLECFLKRGLSGGEQVNATIAFLRKNQVKFGNLWLDVERSPPWGTKTQVRLFLSPPAPFLS
jgi:hypothetical protein